MTPFLSKIRSSRVKKTLEMSYSSFSTALPMLDAVSEFKRLATLAAIGILLLTALGSCLVVSYATRNLRSFSRQLRLFKPPEFTQGVVFTPHSAEENCCSTAMPRWCTRCGLFWKASVCSLPTRLMS